MEQLLLHKAYHPDFLQGALLQSSCAFPLFYPTVSCPFFYLPADDHRLSLHILKPCQHGILMLPPAHVPADYLHNMPGLHEHILSHTILQNKQSSDPTLPSHAGPTALCYPASAALIVPQCLLRKRTPELPPAAASNPYVRSDMPAYTH